jgi:hypothetical protein
MIALPRNGFPDVVILPDANSYFILFCLRMLGVQDARTSEKPSF